MTQATDQERAEFEAAYVAEKLRIIGSDGSADGEKAIRRIHLRRNANGDYDNSLAAHFAWWAWQAARRAQVVPKGCSLREALETIASYPYSRDQEMGATVMRKVARDALAAAPKPPESNSPEFDGIKAAHVPKFNHAARRKLELLLGDGATITGYAIEKDGRRGAIDCHGFVYWWNDAAPVQLPEPRWYSPSPGDAAHFPYYTPEDVSQILAQHGIE